LVTDYLLEDRSIKETFFFVALNKLIDSFFGDELEEEEEEGIDC
jgi:hypothetical protein